MEWTGLNQLRSMFLEFFVSKGHVRMDSFPLVPQDDKSLLLINSGMAPLKKYFLGQATVPGNRATTCQKCIRTPDIERVGKTSRHGTYFEMLGNFSFGDYFKKEATAWAWEFLTEVVKMDPNRLYCSVFYEDDEAYDIWTKGVGVSDDHMVRLGREDNFWEIGSGPCGPCSEIYYDRGEEYGCGKEDCAPGCDCDRYVEIWNLVFTQFISDGNGNYSKMARPNIDTGMGLERLACMVQGVGNLFEVDTVRNIMRHVERITGKKYLRDEKTDISLRVITDHIRSTVFMVSDGVAPSNEGRGYVLRRLLRRAARHGRLLGVNRAFLYEVCDTVIDENAGAYPELTERRAYIRKVIQVEEERFERTINLGLSMAEKAIDDLKAGGETVLSGELAFRLNDTYGFPLDLISELVSEAGFTVDTDAYDALMAQQKERARADAKKRDVSWESDLFRGLRIEPTQFLGYDSLATDSAVLFIAVDGERSQTAGEGDTVQVILDVTPFYAESGGQIGDVGTLSSGAASVQVEDCRKTAEGYYVHYGQVTKGQITEGDAVKAAVDAEVRRATMRNHTAAHLLQQALRDVLGDHVHQSGSYVDSRRVRFDFSHFAAVTPDELKKVEEIVNDRILDFLPVSHSILPIEEARKAGAIALFGEKYGDTVRVIDAGGYSVEFCGGTHVDNTGRLGLFRILSESSVAAGIRRIEATTGRGVLDVLHRQDALIGEVCAIHRAGSAAELPERARAAVTALREAEHLVEKVQARQAGQQADSILSTGVDCSGVKVYASRFEGSVEALRAAASSVRDKDPDSVTLLGSVIDGKVSLCVTCGAQAQKKGLKAGSIVKEAAALAGGSGGGRADIAMAGAKNPGALDEVLAALPGIVKKQLEEGDSK